MKILDRYILTSYLSRLASVFFILMLIFIIQTFWLFIDEFAGKGIDAEIIFKFLLYYSPKLYPLVLPLSVLLASIMTYGDFAENYEFAAMKSTGISLQRALLGLIIFHFFLGIGSFYFSNHVIPYGEFKYFNLRRNMAKLKPALAITEGIFNDLGAMNIKVDRKYGEDNRFLENIIIHEITPDNQNRIVIKAERGELKSAKIGQQLQLVLFDGNRYEEVQTSTPAEQRKAPHAKVSFREYIMNIDLSQFNNVDLGEEKYTSTYRMQQVKELTESIDSLELQFKEQREIYADNFIKSNAYNSIKSLNNPVVLDADSIVPDSIFALYSNPLKFVGKELSTRHTQVLQTAETYLLTLVRNLDTKKRLFFIDQKRINLHKNTYHEKFTLGFSVFFLFLIGASIGAIIRKGGLGLPMVLAILIFLTYHYIGLFGRNASEDNSLTPFMGSWLSLLIIAPLALYFTKRASTDKGLVNYDFVVVGVQSFISSIKNTTLALRNKLWKKTN
ncbi:LptF/LptG family permease [Flavobacteriaceae bacterium]|jgi:lipopolysaccharide export system permease protein|nr:LptF/LptG family permease [Flavobacteriaceae bacterium]MDA9886306.1 LptF/LptG family permease [Flavobacteriaceae bacterium]MDB4113075.1 LptF/LptG family permease [Flavobacteriaceae bacterium]MDB4186171.1 LptF/LptG family permease [Flavobacteriaceae bacterium]MDB9886622.1 LptF/LptG family permease [Flavobacteriaceae bacterium]